MKVVKINKDFFFTDQKEHIPENIFNSMTRYQGTEQIAGPFGSIMKKETIKEKYIHGGTAD